MSNLFNNSRTAEILDAAEGDKSRTMVVSMAASLGALQAAIAILVGKRILSDDGEVVRSAFSTLSKCGLVAVCKTADDVKLFQSVCDALQRDLSDLKNGR